MYANKKTDLPWKTKPCVEQTLVRKPLFSKPWPFEKSCYVVIFLLAANFRNWAPNRARPQRVEAFQVSLSSQKEQDWFSFWILCFVKIGNRASLGICKRPAQGQIQDWGVNCKQTNENCLVILCQKANTSCVGLLTDLRKGSLEHMFQETRNRGTRSRWLLVALVKWANS